VKIVSWQIILKGKEWVEEKIKEGVEKLDMNKVFDINYVGRTTQTLTHLSPYEFTEVFRFFMKLDTSDYTLVLDEKTTFKVDQIGYWLTIEVTKKVGIIARLEMKDIYYNKKRIPFGTDAVIVRQMLLKSDDLTLMQVLQNTMEKFFENLDRELFDEYDELRKWFVR
jgi:hypothetical protein